MGVAVADYDNDGYEDVFVTGYGGNHLYHNNGDCTFTDVTEKAGVGGSGWSTGRVGRPGQRRPARPGCGALRHLGLGTICGAASTEGYRGICHPTSFLPITMLVYHNDGNGHFTEVGHKLGLDKPAKALGIAIADYDRDGRIDLFVANDSMPEFLFHQKPDGTFEEVGLESACRERRRADLRRHGRRFRRLRQ
jgi:hypothetical protein